MARLLKNVYSKASTHSQFCSYSTKANPYVEVLRTLRLREQDLRNRTKILPSQNEGQKLSNGELHSTTNESTNLNHHESFHLIDDSSMINHTRINENIYEHTLPSNEFSPENFKNVNEELNVSKDQFPKQEDIKLSSVEHSSKNFISINQDQFNTLKSAFPQDNIGTIKHIRDFKERTTNKIITKSESSRIKKKKSKRTKATSSLSETEVRASAENLSNSLPSKNLIEVSSDLSPTDDAKNINLTNFKERTPCQNACVHPQTKETKVEPLIFVEKKENEVESSKHLGEMFPMKESSLEFLNNLMPKRLNIPIKSDEKTAVKIICDKQAPKGKSKSKSSKAKSESSLCDMKETQRLKFKEQKEIQSLKSLVEAYINANEIHKADRIFEYFLQDQKKKRLVDVNLFNSVISGWAREGRLDKVKNLFFLMSNEKITPNLQSYAGYLEAISRSRSMDVAEISKIINEMKSHGFSYKDLLQKCVFAGDQRGKIMQVLGFVERDLSLPLYVPEQAYSLRLIEKLNDKDYEKGNSDFNMCYESKDIANLSSNQMEIEDKAVIKIKSINTVTVLNDKIIKSREYIKECEDLWRNRLTKAINNLKTPKKQGLLPNQAIYPYLTVIDTDILVNLLLQETRFLGETAEFYSPNIKVLYRDLGVKVMRHYFMSLNKMNNVTKKVHFIYKRYLDYLLDPELSAKYLPREYWEFLKSKYPDGPTIDVSISPWPYSLLIFIGSILYDVLRSNISFNPNRIARKSKDNFMYPAFHVVYVNNDVKLNRQIRAHDMFSKLYRSAKLEYLEFDVTLVPMLSPPRPWIKYDSGAMLITKVPFIRFPEQARSLTSFYNNNVPSSQLNPCFDSLNNLSLCPWIINKPILDIVIKIFQDGGSEHLDIPLNPANYHLDKKFIDESSGTSSYKYKMQYEKKKYEMTSLWFDCLYKLSIANHFRDRIFWFPHNLDFRGRVYPTPPHFNHLGNDLSRSILLFAAGKPLGEKGLDWLKMHLINLTGFKKRAPHAERLEYANEILPEILDSADNPFGGKKWWMTSDKPLQTLACCKEVASAVRHPNPAEYVSHFPVHQDGSCNGLQHYAALGRDEFGATEVNLNPSYSPQDVYSGVAALVEKERERDASTGHEIAQALEGFITRRVVKQTVMTFVYGVTSYGAKHQVLKQLRDIPEFPEKYYDVAASYVTGKIFSSIGEMFTASKAIQDWFTQCADVITKITKNTVEWVTPLGLPVIQPYYKETTVRSSKFCLSKGSTENINHYVSHFEPYQPPDPKKQKNGFAPNFIHSLDSTHMMLTSLFCHRKGVTFVSVHDCYWTHACTVNIMNKICREQFVSLHSEPILENLSAFFLERFASEKNSQLKPKKLSTVQNVLSQVPNKGNFNLNKVLNSEYFFS